MNGWQKREKRGKQANAKDPSHSEGSRVKNKLQSQGHDARILASLLSIQRRWMDGWGTLVPVDKSQEEGSDWSGENVPAQQGERERELAISNGGALVRSQVRTSPGERKTDEFQGE